MSQIILMAGLQGVGKTTACGKLALYLRKQKKKVLMVATDVYRPAAIEQLVKLGERIKVPVFEQGTDAKPDAIAAAGIKHVQLFDTLAAQHMFSLHEAPIHSAVSNILAVASSECNGCITEVHQTCLSAADDDAAVAMLAVTYTMCVHFPAQVCSVANARHHVPLVLRLWLGIVPKLHGAACKNLVIVIDFGIMASSTYLTPCLSLLLLIMAMCRRQQRDLMLSLLTQLGACKLMSA